MRNYPLCTVIRSNRWWRPTPWSANRLIRPSDRLMSSLIIAAVAVVTFAIPVSAAIGTSVYATERVRIEQQYTAYKQWNGTVTTSSAVVPLMRDVGDPPKVVTWTVNGLSRTEPLIGHASAQPGDAITVWTNDRDEQVQPPSETSNAAIWGTAVAILLYGTVALVMYVVVTVAGKAINRHNDRMWDLEWKNKFQRN